MGIFSILWGCIPLVIVALALQFKVGTEKAKQVYLWGKRQIIRKQSVASVMKRGPFLGTGVGFDSPGCSAPSEVNEHLQFLTLVTTPISLMVWE